MRNPSQAFINIDIWKICYEDKPPKDIWLLVFRSKNNKYHIFKASMLRDEDENEKLHWVSQFGNVHEIDDDDIWAPFELVRKEVLYDQ
jgi:hypothetical protein